jgi:hypothetical protein
MMKTFTPFILIALVWSSAAATTCNYTQEVYCKQHCINATDFDVSIEACESQGKSLQCMNPRGQVSDGSDGDDHNGDFFPACASPDAQGVTDFPTLPDYPCNDEACTDFAQVYETTDYANTITLPGGSGALFQFSLVDGEILKGRLAFNGIFGFLAFGFIGPEYPKRNPMHGGKVILAMNGGNYTASEGLDLSLGPQVNEYIISPKKGALPFRFWQTPFVDGEGSEGGGDEAGGGGGGGGAIATSRGAGHRELHELNVQTSENGCYTSLTFEVEDIGGQYLNLTGTDTFMWSANDVDTYMQYHGSNRGLFTITWSEIVPSAAAAPEQAAPSGANTKTKSSGTMATSLAAVFLAVLIAAIV